MLDDYPDVLTVAQVCAVLDIGRNSAYLLLQSQGLKSVRVGRKYLIPKRYVLDFLGLSDYTKLTHPTIETANPDVSWSESEGNQ